MNTIPLHLVPWGVFRKGPDYDLSSLQWKQSRGPSYRQHYRTMGWGDQTKKGSLSSILGALHPAVGAPCSENTTESNGKKHAKGRIECYNIMNNNVT